MNCQILFPGENEKNYSIMWSAEIFTQSANVTYCDDFKAVDT